MTIKVGIVGATGFAGAELARLLIAHPSFDLTTITSDSAAEEPLAHLYPSFAGASDLVFKPYSPQSFDGCEAVFLAVPHTAALSLAPGLIDAGISVFDLSADYRLADPAVYEAWYGTPHTSANLLEQAFFGLPEIMRKDVALAAAVHMRKEPVLMACAGCYPTATSLAAYPAKKSKLITPPIIVDAISGVTGAGRKATERTHFCFANESVEAYGVGTHRHTPEIEQILGLSSGDVVFTPHLAPLGRGLLSTVTMMLADTEKGIGADDIFALYDEYYAECTFVTVLPLGQQPKTSSVVGTNRCHIGLALNERSGALIATSAIDNLCKGAAGQAVQCANIVFGLDEGCGLGQTALPV